MTDSFKAAGHGIINTLFNAKKSLSIDVRFQGFHAHPCKGVLELIAISCVARSEFWHKPRACAIMRKGLDCDQESTLIKSKNSWVVFPYGLEPYPFLRFDPIPNKPNRYSQQPGFKAQRKDRMVWPGFNAQGRTGWCCDILGLDSGHIEGQW